MELKLSILVLGSLQNNVFVLSDEETKDAVVVDQGFEPETTLNFLKENGYTLRQVWVTHGHYDHFIGVPELMDQTEPRPLFGMNPESYAYAMDQGSQRRFRSQVESFPKVDLPLAQGTLLPISPGGKPAFEVREVPGHCPGSVIFYCEGGGFAIVGDAIFKGSIGRTDFAGGDEALLLKSIREQIFTMPPETRLFPGHGPETTVADEIAYNPFFNR